MYKISGKQADTADEGETTSRQRKGKSQKKTCDVTDVHQQQETNVECVMEAAHGRRSKQIKNYEGNLSLNCVLDLDDRQNIIEKTIDKYKKICKE